MPLPRVLPLALCGIALASCITASADTKVKFINDSGKPWIVRVVPNGKKTGGSLKFNDKKLGDWEGFPIPANKTVEVTFSYAISYCVRFQILDQFGNWAELGSELKATQSFSTSKRYQNLYNSVGDPEFTAVSAAIKTDYPKNGDITISKENLAPGNPPAQAYSGPSPAVIYDPPAPFFSTYIFNRSAGTYSLQLTAATKAQAPVGKLVLTTDDGRLLAEFNRDTKAALPPGIFRVILLPDKKSGTNTTDVTLLDPQANGGRFQFWYKPDQGGSLQVSNDQKAEFYGYLSLNDYKDKRSMQINGFPGQADVTLVKAAFPKDLLNNANKNGN